MSMLRFNIDFSETFGNLPDAPIVEAVIHWKAHSGTKLDADAFLAKLTEKLPDYPEPQRQQEIHVGAEINSGGSSVQQKQVWRGFRFESEDKLHVAQFTRNGFSFSRLKPYEDWSQFEAEALRLWKINCEVADPPEVQRLGVRFINLIGLESIDKLDEVLVSPPVAPASMGVRVQGFMHQTRFEIPGHDYNLNVIQTVQPPAAQTTADFRLILDLDVFTTQRSAVTDEILQQRLAEMRWIKNKAFFSFLTENALERFKE